MRKTTPKLTTKKPVSVFEKPLQADYKAIFKALSNGVGHVASGKWEELGNDAVEALGAIGLVTEPGELACLLIQRSLVRALFDLVSEIAAQYLTEVKDEAGRLEALLNFTVSSSEIFIDQKFLERPEDLPILGDLKPLLEAWLEAQGVPHASAQAVSMMTERHSARGLSVFKDNGQVLNRAWRQNACPT
jgi:hypothetical protein